MPSPRYSLSGAASRDAKGSTAIDVGTSRASQPESHSATAAAASRASAAAGSEPSSPPRPGDGDGQAGGGPEGRHIGARRELDHHAIMQALGPVVLAQPLAKMSGLYAHHRVAAGIEVAPPAKDVDRHHAFLDVAHPAFERFFDHETEELLHARGAGKGGGSQDLFEALANLAGVHPRARRGCGNGRHGSVQDADMLNVLRLFNACKRLKYQGFNTLNTRFNAGFTLIAHRMDRA